MVTVAHGLVGFSVFSLGLGLGLGLGLVTVLWSLGFFRFRVVSCLGLVKVVYVFEGFTLFNGFEVFFLLGYILGLVTVV